MASPDSPDTDGPTVPLLVESDEAALNRTREGGQADVLILDTEHVAPLLPEETVILELEQFLPDESGEIVLFAEEELPLNIVAHEAVTEAGIADAHVTAAGVDVTGHHFYSFESGITLYSPTDLLIVTDLGTI